MWPTPDADFEALLSNVPAVFYADTHEVEPRGLYVSSNAGAVLGADAALFTREQGQWWERVHPDDVDALRTAWLRAFARVEPYVLTYRFRRDDGSTIWLREHAVPVRGPDGMVEHWQGMVLDVTAERAISADIVESERRHREHLANMPVFVYAISD
jgi:PAS domain S-box-containing protein